LVSRFLGDQPDALALDPTTEAQVAANSATVADTRTGSHAPLDPAWAPRGMMSRCEQMRVSSIERSVGLVPAPEAYAEPLERAVAACQGDADAAKYLDVLELHSELAETYDRLGRVEDALRHVDVLAEQGYACTPDPRCHPGCVGGEGDCPRRTAAAHTATPSCSRRSRMTAISTRRR
jgi:hypothetical protein